jgi:hypothetical protein
MFDRRVHRLRLHAGSDDDVRRGAILVEDAVRVASLPAGWSARHYVVRRLDLGAFSRDAAPQTLALRVERGLAQLAALAEPATSPAAATAPAVWFDDEATAIAALAERVAVGPAPSEWYWRRIAEGAAALGGGDALLACVIAAAALPAGPRAVALVIDRVERARGGAVLDRVEAWSGDALITRTFGARAPDPRPPPVAIAQVAQRLTPAWRARLIARAAAWRGDARAVWLAALALVDSASAPAGTARLLERARDLAAWAEATVASSSSAPPEAAAPIMTAASEPAREAAPREAAPREAATSIDAPGAAAPRDAAPPADREPPAIAPLPIATAQLPSRSAEPIAPAPAPIAAPPARVAARFDEPTAIGGLLFVLRALDALDLPGWLDRHDWASASGFGAALLDELAAACGARDGDPLRAALAELYLPERRPRRLLIRRAWQRAAERWLLAATRLTLAQIVQRPARVAITRTHVDVAMPLRTADVAIRLAGLDLDPGWVPWLGRVVRFHYLEAIA